MSALVTFVLRHPCTVQYQSNGLNLHLDNVLKQLRTLTPPLQPDRQRS